MLFILSCCSHCLRPESLLNGYRILACIPLPRTLLCYLTCCQAGELTSYLPYSILFPLSMRWGRGIYKPMGSHGKALEIYDAKAGGCRVILHSAVLGLKWLNF